MRSFIMESHDNSADWPAGVLAGMLQQLVVSPGEKRPGLTRQFPELTDS
jgi:hypothetical protein